MQIQWDFMPRTELYTMKKFCKCVVESFSKSHTIVSLKANRLGAKLKHIDMICFDDESWPEFS